MIIDWHTHIHTPESQASDYWQGRCPMNIENILAAQENAGIDVTVISNALHMLSRLEPDEQLEKVKQQNRYVAEIQAAYPDQIIGFATAVPCGDDRFLRELERAVTEDGLKGAISMSSLKHVYPDNDAARPFFNLLTKLDIPIMFHPPAVGYGEEMLKEYRLASSIGRPADNCLALARLIVRGILEDFPTLKLVGSHLGGGICEVIGRMDYAYELQDEAYFLGEYAPLRISHPPSHYLKMIYLDCVCYHAPAARCAIETVGADHVLFGTDAPPLTVLKPRAVAMIDSLNLNATDRELIMAGNAKHLMNLN